MTKSSKNPNPAAPAADADISTSQTELSQNALEKKQSADDPEWQSRQTETPGDGPIPGRRDVEPVMGAFDAEGQRPVLERSRKVR